VRIKVLAAATGFTDSFIGRGRYPDFKGPLPFTPGYELVGVVEKAGSGVPRRARDTNRGRFLRGRWLRAICHSARASSCGCSCWRRCGRGRLHPARLPHSLPDADALSWLLPGETILVIGASGTVGTALFDLARHFGLKAIGTCSAANFVADLRSGA
jgi:NADPH:quinone reductase-like Zn-dependent oxidoreductase